MNKITEKNQIIIMYIFTSIVYFMSYLTRVNYNTVLVEISSAENISRSLLSLPLTASFITYGAGQIISGWMGDKFDAFKVVSAGLFLSVIMNILLPIFPIPWVMIILWGINGFAQALIYPPLIKIAARYLSGRGYENVCLFTTIAGHSATLLLYVLSPVVISFLNWKFVFIFTFIIAAVFLVTWQIYSARVKKVYGPSQTEVKTDGKNKETAAINKIFVGTGLGMIMVAVVMMGFLRDGITTWMPAYLSDEFSLSNELSILTTVILPVTSIFTSYAILTVQRKLCRDETKLTGIVFAIAILPIAALLCLKTNMVFSISALTITSICSQATNFLLICLLPKRFEKTGRISLVTGLLNSCTYIGAACSTYTIAKASENVGWNLALMLWGIAALVGAVFCIVAVKKRKM